MSGGAHKADVTFEAAGLDALIRLLAAEGREVWGPVERDGAVDLAVIAGADDLPKGRVETQAGGHYRLADKGNAYFGVRHGPTSWKRLLHPPRQTLWSTETVGGVPKITPAPRDDTPRAFLGVRPCDLAAIRVQDRVFEDVPYKDTHYEARRTNAFLVAVNCTHAAATCFCASMDTGPRAGAGYDIALTELDDGRFVAEAGTEAGEALLAKLAAETASDGDLQAVADGTKRAALEQTRHIDRAGLPELLKSSPDHPRWDEVATRCLSCANCTMVCPTCFCTTVDEISALDGSATARENRWASCFTNDFTHVHGGAVRKGGKSRYRQWMTHKLATWVDQFDQMGCTGCGRCITWCPVGIDITEEAAAIRAATPEMAGGRHGD